VQPLVVNFDLHRRIAVDHNKNGRKRHKAQRHRIMRRGARGIPILWFDANFVQRFRKRFICSLQRYLRFGIIFIELFGGISNGFSADALILNLNKWQKTPGRIEQLRQNTYHGKRRQHQQRTPNKLPMFPKPSVSAAPQMRQLTPPPSMP